MIRIVEISTIMGTMTGGTTDKGLCFLGFGDNKACQSALEKLKKLLDCEVVFDKHPHLEILSSQLWEYFKNQRTQFTVPLDLQGTPFQIAVWDALLAIPYGSTCSYLEQAEKVGNPKSVRAVARANGSNWISIVVPCHRVIGTDGKLVGYGGGLDRKQFLLIHESALLQNRLL